MQKERSHGDQTLFEGSPEECRKWLEAHTPVTISFVMPTMCEQIAASGHPEWPPVGWSEDRQWIVAKMIGDRLYETGGFKSAEDALRRGLSRIADGTIYAL